MARSDGGRIGGGEGAPHNTSATASTTSPQRGYGALYPGPEAQNSSPRTIRLQGLSANACTTKINPSVRAFGNRGAQYGWETAASLDAFRDGCSGADEDVGAGFATSAAES